MSLGALRFLPAWAPLVSFSLLILVLLLRPEKL